MIKVAIAKKVRFARKKLQLQYIVKVPFAR